MTRARSAKASAPPPAAPPPVAPVENPFANYSDIALADAMGDLDVQGDRIGDLMKAAKAEVDRRHRLSLVGLRFDVTKSTETERRLDSKGLKAKYGTTWYEGWYKASKRTKWTITPKPPEELGVPA